MTDLFASDYRDEPFWWDRTPRPEMPETALPASVDIVVIGSGYTGLNAAIQTARAGRTTLVLEADALGQGCSTRNGGQVSTSMKPDHGSLSRKYGSDRALAMLREGHNAFEWIADFIRTEGLDCDFERVGRFIGAHTPAKFEEMCRKPARPRGIEIECHPVSRAEQAAEIDTDFYYGGLVYPNVAGLDPAAYHQGLVGLARAARAELVDNCRVTGLEKDGPAWRVTTQRGSVMARNVIVATNGYTGPLTPWQRRRVIPIGSYIIATEKLPPEQIARLVPNRRMLGDTRKLVFYYRTCPANERIVFGGRVSIAETDPRASAPLLHEEMVRIFPELARTRITHSWMGFVAYTFDQRPHIGSHDGLFYSMGYCGSGVSLASYFGMRIGQQAAGLAEGRTALDDLDWPTRPFYTGRPWFLAPSVRYYKWRDSLGRPKS